MTTSGPSQFRLARTIATAAVGGAVLLVALDFAGGDPPPAGPAALIEQRLRSVANIDLFTVVDVPGTDLEVSTGTQYADARALADGRIAERWCYVEQAQHGTSFKPHIELGRQSGEALPVFTLSAITPDQARQLGLSADALTTIAHRDCRFVG